MAGFTKEELALFEEALMNYASPKDEAHEYIFTSMKYSLMAGGKRIRPYIVWAFAKYFGVKFEDMLPFACAIEMIHTYSLIHDDLPCMDDDDLRRGKPTNHKVFGEAIAVIAGDSLLTLAFDTALCEKTIKKVGARKAAKAAGVLARFAGAEGMCAGQVLDILSEGKNISAETLFRLDSEKTSALIAASALMGCIIGGADKKQLNAAFDFAYNLGIAFQVIDDILDATSTEEELGKPIGSDEDNDKSTYVSLFGIEKAKEKADELTIKAIGALDIFGENADEIREFAKELLRRKN